MNALRKLRRLFVALALAGSTLLLPACAGDGHFTILGYSSRPNYDTRFQTVRVPIFKARTYWAVTPVVGMEMDLTRAVVREITDKTPYRVVDCDADTELLGTIVNFSKNILNYTQFNTVREAETLLVVELIWRDTRTGEILSRSARRLGEARVADPRQPLFASADSLLPPGSKPVVQPVVPTAPDAPPAPGDRNEEEYRDPVTKKKIDPIVLRSIAGFRPELGESLTTAMQKNIDRMAVQIVSAMELGW